MSHEAPAQSLGDQCEVKRRAACDECSETFRLAQRIEAVADSCCTRDEEAQMRWRAASMLAMPERKDCVRLQSSEAYGTAQEENEEQ